MSQKDVPTHAMPMTDTIQRQGYILCWRRNKYHAAYDSYSGEIVDITNGLGSLEEALAALVLWRLENGFTAEGERCA